MKIMEIRLVLTITPFITTLQDTLFLPPPSSSPPSENDVVQVFKFKYDFESHVSEIFYADFAWISQLTIVFDDDATSSRYQPPASP